jgi:hypothetical protein
VKRYHFRQANVISLPGLNDITEDKRMRVLRTLLRDIIRVELTFEDGFGRSTD